MPTDREARHRMATAKTALSLCKKALMPKALAHPTIVSVDDTARGGVVIDRKAYYAAMRALATYELDVEALGGKNVADVEPGPEAQHAGDDDALEAALAELEA